MKIDTDIVAVFTATLDEEEATYLRNVLQNPPHSATGEGWDEDPRDRNIRQRVFESLDKALSFRRQSNETHS